jgi:hypothetical protein
VFSALVRTAAPDPPVLETRREPRESRELLANHVRDLVSIDFFTVPTARLRVLFVLVVLAHHRRRVLHFNVTEHPIAAGTAQQIVDAFPHDSAPAYLLRDRNQIYGQHFRHRVESMGTDEVIRRAMMTTRDFLHALREAGVPEA